MLRLSRLLQDVVREYSTIINACRYFTEFPAGGFALPSRGASQQYGWFCTGTENMEKKSEPWGPTNTEFTDSTDELLHNLLNEKVAAACSAMFCIDNSWENHWSNRDRSVTRMLLMRWVGNRMVPQVTFSIHELRQFGKLAGMMGFSRFSMGSWWNQTEYL